MNTLKEMGEGAILAQEGQMILAHAIEAAVKRAWTRLSRRLARFARLASSEYPQL
jgi:hypothetical protein